MHTQITPKVMSLQSDVPSITPAPMTILDGGWDVSLSDAVPPFANLNGQRCH